MPRKIISEPLVLVAGKVRPDTRDEVERLARLDDRPVSAMVRRLIEIGLSVERSRVRRRTKFVATPPGALELPQDEGPIGQDAAEDPRFISASS